MTMLRFLLLAILMIAPKGSLDTRTQLETSFAARYPDFEFTPQWDVMREQKGKGGRMTVSIPLADTEKYAGYYRTTKYPCKVSLNLYVENWKEGRNPEFKLITEIWREDLPDSQKTGVIRYSDLESAKIMTIDYYEDGKLLHRENVADIPVKDVIQKGRERDVVSNYANRDSYGTFGQPNPEPSDRTGSRATVKSMHNNYHVTDTQFKDYCKAEINRYHSYLKQTP